MQQIIPNTSHANIVTGDCVRTLDPGIYNSFTGVTDNQSERFNSMLKRLQSWHEVPVDGNILSLWEAIAHGCSFPSMLASDLDNWTNDGWGVFPFTDADAVNEAH